MPTTNANTAKLAIINALKAQTGPGLPLAGIDVQYAYRGDMGAQAIYGGGWRFTSADAVAETPGVLLYEDVTLSLYIRVVQRPANDVEIGDAIADSILTAVGVVFKAQPRIGGQMAVTGIASGMGDYSGTDEETISIQAIQVTVGSSLSWG